MLYYREKKTWKKLAVNAVKGAAVVGAAVWIWSCFGMAPKQKEDESRIVVAQAVYDEKGSTVSSVPETIPASAEVPEPSKDPTVACGSFIEPAVGVLTSEFGSRWGRQHTGIDIGGENGSEILAADGGKVIVSGWVSGYGNYIVIDHENGYQTAYGHCSELLVTEGERVAQGQLIAYMGSTGNSTGPHLHFEIKADGEYQNPMDYGVY